MSDPTALCPICRGSVHPNAMACPHCGAEIPVTGPLIVSPPSPATEAPTAAEVPPATEAPTLVAQRSSATPPPEALPSTPPAVALPTESTQMTDQRFQPDREEPGFGSGRSTTPPPPPLLEIWRANLEALEASLAWNEAWFFLMWGFLFLTYFIN